MRRRVPLREIRTVNPRDETRAVLADVLQRQHDPVRLLRARDLLLPLRHPRFPVGILPLQLLLDLSNLLRVVLRRMVVGSR